MDTTNGHCAVFVKAINDIFQTAQYFKDAVEITHFLALRYKDEVYEKLITDEGDRETQLLERWLPREFFNSIGNDFLTQVCDNDDLKTIITYCKYDENHQFYNEFHKVTFTLANGVKGGFTYGVNGRTQNNRHAKAMLEYLRDNHAEITTCPIDAEEYLRATGQLI